jgi:hypothetical protein
MHYLQQDKETKTANTSLMGSFFGIGSFMGTQKEKNYVDSHGIPIDLSKIPGCIQCQYDPYLIR